jgi:uncharacterized protein (DUF2252 family)
LKRLAASAVAAVRFLGGKEALCRKSVLAAVKSYRKHMKQYAGLGTLELHYCTIRGSDLMNSIPKATRKGAEKIITKARNQTHMQVLEKLTDIIDKKNRLRENAPFIVHETKTKAGRSIDEALELMLRSYFDSLGNDRKHLLTKFRIVDVVRKVVGVGSVGTRCWVIFLEDNHNQEPLFLQLKEAQPSVLEPYAAKSTYANQGQRAVGRWRWLMQNRAMLQCSLVILVTVMNWMKL